MMINTALGACASVYSSITDALLNFLTSDGSSLLLWAEVLRMDYATLARESEHSSSYGVGHTAGGGLAHAAHAKYFNELSAASTEHIRRRSDCRDKSCQDAEDARFCGEWMSLYAQWENVNRQRYTTAARSFDRVATQTVMHAENEWLQLRDYTVRQLKKMRFPKTPGDDMEGMMLKGVNDSLRNDFDRHFGGDGDTVRYLGEQATWFQEERAAVEDNMVEQANDMEEQICAAARRAVLEQLAQEEWQAYRDHLKDRVSWDVDPKTEEEFPCEGAIGPVSVKIDTTTPGSGLGKFDLKWKTPLYKSGDDGASFSAGSSIGVGGESGEDSASVSSNYGPFAGKVKVTLTKKVNPFNSQEYMGIKVKGSAGFGLKRGKLSVACYPSSGSVTIYPRSLYDDAVRYLSTPVSPPPRGHQ